MTGTNLLTEMDKILPIIIGVVFFLGVVLIETSIILYIIWVITKKKKQNQTSEKLDNSRIRIALLSTAGTIILSASGIVYILTQIKIIGSKSGNLTVPIIVFYGCLLYAGSIVINNTRKN